MEATTTTNTKGGTKYLVELALMIAIIFVMAFTPLGYLRTPGLSITFLTVPVAVAAMILGPKGGAICGAAFGITSLLQCFGTSAFGAMLLGINPFGTVFSCIVPRILEGLLSGLIFKAVRSKNKNLAYFAGGLACPGLKNIFFMGSLGFFFFNTSYISGFLDGLCGNNTFSFFVDILCVRGVTAAIVCYLTGASG